MAANDNLDTILALLGAAAGTLNTPNPGTVQVHQQLIDPALLKQLGTSFAGSLAPVAMGPPQLAPREVRQAALGPGRSDRDAQMLAGFESINERMNSIGADPGRSPLDAHLQNDLRLATMGANARAASEWDVNDWNRANSDKWRGASELNSLLQGAATYSQPIQGGSDLGNFLSGLIEALSGSNAQTFLDWLRGLGGDDLPPGDNPGGGDNPNPDGTDGGGDNDPGNSDPGDVSNPIDNLANALSGGGIAIGGLGLGALLGWLATRGKLDANTARDASVPLPPAPVEGSTQAELEAWQSAMNSPSAQATLAARSSIITAMAGEMNPFLPGITVTMDDQGLIHLDPSTIQWNQVNWNDPGVRHLLTLHPDIAEAATQAIQSQVNQMYQGGQSPFGGIDPGQNAWGQDGSAPGAYQQALSQGFQGWQNAPAINHWAEQRNDPQLGGPSYFDFETGQQYQIPGGSYGSYNDGGGSVFMTPEGEFVFAASR